MASSELLAQIQAGRKLKKAVTNDRSAPAVDGPKGGAGGGRGPAGGGGGGPSLGGGAGPPQLGGLFAGGMPKLKPAGQNNLAKPPTIGKPPTIPKRDVPSPAPPVAPAAPSPPARPSPAPPARSVPPPARAVPPPVRAVPPPSAPSIPSRPAPSLPSRVVPVPPSSAPEPPRRAPPPMHSAPAIPARPSPAVPARTASPAPSPVVRAPPAIPSRPPVHSPGRVVPPPPTTPGRAPPPPPPRPSSVAPPPPVRSPPAPTPPPRKLTPSAPTPPVRARALSVTEPDESPSAGRLAPPPSRTRTVSAGATNGVNNARPPPPRRKIPSPPPTVGSHTFPVSDFPPPRPFGTQTHQYPSGRSRGSDFDLDSLYANSLPSSATMRISSFLLPSLLSLVSYVAAEEASDVLSLTASTFHDIDSESLILVEFFAPWCGHCKALAPHYEEAATKLKTRGIKLAKVDCVDQADLCQSNGIQGYPTLKVYKNGTPSEYTGPRKADGIESYMIKQSLPAVTTVNEQNFDEFKMADNIAVVAFVESTTSAPAAAFSKAAEAHRDDYLFGLSTDSSLMSAQKISAPSIVVYRKFDEPVTTYPYPVLDATEADITEWVTELAVPILGEVSSENYALYANSPKPLAYFFVDPSVQELSAQLDLVRSIAGKFKSKMNFVWIDAIKYGDHAKALNLADVNWPSFVIQDLKKGLKYPYDQQKAITAAPLEDFVNSYLDGHLEPSLKSQPIPEEQVDNVYDLVGKEFDKIVFDDSKDVFIEFYASWCGHCKRLKPTWDSLADHYAPLKKTLTIVKFEATENDLPPSVPFSISGFPTIKFKKAGTRDFIDYEGDRSYESLSDFCMRIPVSHWKFLNTSTRKRPRRTSKLRQTLKLQKFMTSCN
ncbi:unnamed protein product [Mycena citricolor]|uniref:protein disulfide-isomerase n=1 Tax=Mycena citricolor TaxID=2018698 RepID=A0AAD2HII8_9AGAR|nr:unnamed protein product [Mycena citricolor]